MSSRINKYGLTRDIPADVRRAVRRECGFGCVTCGFAVAEYEHFHPRFEEAREHRAEGIALLCGTCHGQKTRGMWSPEKVADARKNPVTFRGRYARAAFDIVAPFTLWIGSSSVEDVSTIVRTHEGERWLAIEPPEVDNGPMRLSATFFDDHGAPSLTIDGNEWKPVSSQWDTEVEGRKITVRRARGVVVLEFIAMPPTGLRLARLEMRKEDLTMIVEPSGQARIARGGVETVIDDCSFKNADAVFLI